MKKMLNVFANQNSIEIPHTPGRMVIIKKKKWRGYGRKQTNPYTLLVRMQISLATVESSVAIPQRS